MTAKSRPDCRCAYVVSIDKAGAPAGDLQILAEYLSTLGTMGCEVIVLDSSSPSVFEENRRVLRWVSRHVAVRQPLDIVRASATVAQSDRIVVSREELRYTADDIETVCGMLDMHEVVEPQDYLDPLPWWGGIEAGRILIHRGIEPLADRGATFAFRKSVVGALRGFDGSGCPDPVRRMAAFGAEVFTALEVFVRCEPPKLAAWMRGRARDAAAEFAQPARTAFFFALLPATMLVALFGGLRMAAAYACAIAFAAIGLALRGRIGTAGFFPLRACFFAPLWLIERSVSVYWALLMKLQHSYEPEHADVAERRPGKKVASGE